MMMEPGMVVVLRLSLPTRLAAAMAATTTGDDSDSDEAASSR